MIEELSDAQLQSLLAHELAHLHYRDPLWQLIATVIESLLFVQPLDYWGAAALQRLFEERSDQWAAQLTGRSKPLAEVLLYLARQEIAVPRRAVSAAMATSQSPLADRLRRLSTLNPKSVMETTRWKHWLLACTLTGLLACAGPEVTSQTASSSLPLTTGDRGIDTTAVPALHDTLAANSSTFPPGFGSKHRSPKFPPKRPVVPADTNTLAQLQQQLRELRQKIRELQQQRLSLLQEYLLQRQGEGLPETREKLFEQFLDSSHARPDTLKFSPPDLPEQLRRRLEKQRQQLEKHERKPGEILRDRLTEDSDTVAVRP